MQARRLALSGSAGYPDEPDFYYLSEAANLGFEVCQDGLPAPLPYGGRCITATVCYCKVADGAGHLSDHYDLQQVHYDRDLVGQRLRLWRKTTPQFAMFGSGKPAAMGTYVKERDLKQHRSTIVAAITKYPSKRAQALVTVLCREYDLKVKWKALQNYVRREGLWPSVSSTVATGSVAASSSMAASSSEPVQSIPVARIADLPRYRDAIITAIRENPGKCDKALATFLLDRYKVCQVHWATLKDSIK